MSAIEYINSMSSALIAVVGAGGAFMALIQCVKMIMSEDEGDVSKAKNNIKTIIKGVVVGLSVTGLIKTIFSII